MVVGEALRRVFAGMTFTLEGKTVNINCHYGDHKELIKWITEKNKKPSLNKYPLIWYVIAPYKEFNGEIEVNSRLVILQSTKIEWLNTVRSVKSYDAIIDPVWRMIKTKLEQTPHLSVLGQNYDKYDIKDEPSYGVDTDNIRLSQNDFSSKSKKGEESISLDVVDGRVIGFKMRLKPNCII